MLPRDVGLTVRVRLMLLYPRVWAQCIVRYRKAALEQPARCATSVWAARGQLSGADVDEAVNEEDGEWLCSICMRTFCRKVQLLAHQAAADG